MIQTPVKVCHRQSSSIGNICAINLRYTNLGIISGLSHKDIETHIEQ